MTIFPQLSALVIFAFVTSISPGPNNYLLLSYGKKYPFRESVPIMAGSFIGFFTLLILSGFGVGEITQSNEYVALGLKIISSIWLLYLAFLLRKISVEPISDEKPKLGFKELFLMQFVNPKAWIMAIGGAASYLPNLGNSYLNVITFALIFCLVGLPCMVVWVFFGELIAKLIKSDRNNQILGWIFFGLLVLSVLLIWV